MSKATRLSNKHLTVDRSIDGLIGFDEHTHKKKMDNDGATIVYLNIIIIIIIYITFSFRTEFMIQPIWSIETKAIKD